VEKKGEWEDKKMHNIKNIHAGLSPVNLKTIFKFVQCCESFAQWHQAIVSVEKRRKIISPKRIKSNYTCGSPTIQRKNTAPMMQSCRKPKIERELDHLSKFSIPRIPKEIIIDPEIDAGTIVYTHRHDRLGGTSHRAQGSLASGHAAKDAGLAQEVERAEEAEPGQTSGRPEDGREIIGRPDSGGILINQSDFCLSQPGPD
jgi:hypothetical protein